MNSLISHFKYASYVARHKFYVFVECYKAGIPWRGLVHDWSKLTPAEWGPYVEKFYGPKPSPRVAGTYDPISVGGSFDEAWLHHQHHNRHHPQFWILRGDNGSTKVLPMPHKYRLEMICDWKGAGRAQGKRDPGEVKSWYLKNKDKMELHPSTRAWVEEQLGITE